MHDSKYLKYLKCSHDKIRYLSCFYTLKMGKWFCELLLKECLSVDKINKNYEPKTEKVHFQNAPWNLETRTIYTK